MGVITTAGVLWIVRLIDRASCDRRATRRVFREGHGGERDANRRAGAPGRRFDLGSSLLRNGGAGGACRPEPGGYRVYGPATIDRLRFVQRAKAVGLSMREVRELVASPHPDVGAERDGLRHLVAHKLAETRRQITDLTALEGEPLYVGLLGAPGPGSRHVVDCACWLPTKEEVKVMTEEIACCGELCCQRCACARGEACDCPDCPCCQG